jgi:hypothetical protein
MADNRLYRRFFAPVYKGDASGDLIEAGDTLGIILASGTDPLLTQNITVISVSENGHVIGWEYDSGNQYLLPQMIHSVAPAHEWICPEEGNVGLVAVDDIVAAVDAFDINGGTPVTGPWAVSADGAAALELALNTALVGNGAATVQYVDTGTDYLTVHVMGTTATITLDPQGALVAL